MKRDEAKKKRRPLSDSVLTALEPEDSIYQIHNQDGIYLRVRPNGRKDWQLRHKRPNGKWSWLGLGGYPLTKWTAARSKANEYKEQLSRGEVPSTPRLDALEKKRTSEYTFASRVEAWHVIKQGNVTAKTLKKNMRRLEMYVLPEMGERDIREIRPVEWVDLLKRIEKQDGTGKETIERTRQVVKEVYTFAMFADYVISNPLEGARQFLPRSDGNSYKWVPIKEMPQLLRDIRTYDGSEIIKIGLFLISRLGLRTEPFRFAEWHEFDLEHAIWHIPGDHMKGKKGKAGKPLDAPLPSQAVSALRRLHEMTGHARLVFPGRNDHDKEVSDAAFLRALYKLGYKGRQTSHGFRHQFSTISHERWPNKTLVIESQLAHEDSSTRGVYNAAEYFDERRILMQWYADHLDELEGR